MGEGPCVVEVGPSEVDFLGLPALPGVRHLSLHPPETIQAGDMAGVPTLAISDWLLARAKVSVPLAGSLQEFLLQLQTHLCTFFFFGQPSNQPGAILGFMVRVCSGNDLWPSTLRSYLLPELHISSRSKTTAPYGCSEDGRNVVNVYMLGYL